MKNSEELRKIFFSNSGNLLFFTKPNSRTSSNPTAGSIFNPSGSNRSGTTHFVEFFFGLRLRGFSYVELKNLWCAKMPIGFWTSQFESSRGWKFVNHDRRGYFGSHMLFV